MTDVKVPPQKRNKKAQINLRVVPELKAAAEQAAADDQRSLTSLIEKLLTDYLRDRGFLPRPGDLPTRRPTAGTTMTPGEPGDSSER